MARFIDSHVHLADPAFDEDRELVIARARDTGARALICIGESLGSADRALQIVEAHRGFVFHTAGVHPHDASSWNYHQDGARLREHFARGAVAVGECGLDYHYDNSPRPAQRRAFADQLALAKELALPVIVHTREAVDDTKAMIDEAGASGIRGVLHCFGGPHELLDAAIRAGWYVSFAGIVTFKKWSDDALIRAVPNDRLLIETDAPYLAPVPHRGKRNEPAFASLTLAKLAAARGVAAEDLGAQTISNTARFFGLAIS